MVVEAPIGSYVRLVCNVEAWPRATLTWILDDTPIHDSNRYTTVHFSKSNCAQKFRAQNFLSVNRTSVHRSTICVCVQEQSVVERYKSVYVLEVKELTAAEFGRYRCVATNDYGKSQADIQLIGSFVFLSLND